MALLDTVHLDTVHLDTLHLLPVKYIVSVQLQDLFQGSDLPAALGQLSQAVSYGLLVAQAVCEVLAKL